MKKLLPLLLLLFVGGCDVQPRQLETVTGTVMEIIPNRDYGDAVIKTEAGEILRFNTAYCSVWKDANVTITFTRSEGYGQSYVYPKKCFVK
jgi:hypothetical protein